MTETMRTHPLTHEERDARQIATLRARIAELDAALKAPCARCGTTRCAVGTTAGGTDA